MRFIFLAVAASLCVALIIPDQEVLEELSGLLRSDESSQKDETEIDPWWSKMASISRSGHESATRLALSVLGLDLSLDGDTEAPQDENKSHDYHDSEEYCHHPHHHQHNHPHDGDRGEWGPGYGDPG